MAKTKEHIHKLRRHKYPNGVKIYFCINDCNFKIEAAFALGKRVLCNMCGEPFEMNEYSVKLSKPHCGACGRYKTIDADGKRRYIDKNRSAQALADLGKSSVESLKDRMSKVVQMEPEEDIL